MRTITVTISGGATTVVNLDDAASAIDTRDAIQAALDETAASALGGKVELSGGVFVVAALSDAGDGALRVGSNTTFQGAGMGLTTIKLAANPGHDVTGIVRTDSGKTNPDGSLQSTHNVVIQNLSIDGNSTNTGSVQVDGFFCGPKPFTLTAADDNIRLVSVEVFSVSRYGFDPHERTTNLTFTSCIARDNGQDGFTIDNCVGVTVTNCEAYQNGRHGFNIVTSSQGVVLSGNSSHDNGGSGIVVQTGNFETRELTSDIGIYGGTVSNNGVDGIVIRQAVNVTIGNAANGEGVSISGNARFGVLVEGGEAVSIDGNTISGNGGGLGSDDAEIRIRGYTQTYLDADVLNDVFVLSSAVSLTNNTIGSGSLPHTYGVSYSDAGSPVIAPSNVFVSISTPSVEDTSKRGTTPLFVKQVTDGDDVIAGSDGRDSITGSGGHDHIAGNNGNDTLYGADGNDTLDGGTGSDTLYGGFGNDTFIADLDDTIIENAKEGTDTVQTAAGSYSLALLGNVENLTFSGTGNFFGTGNAGDNVIAGGGGHDRLDGGAGADTLSGGLGNDTYVVDDIADVLVDTGGIDTIQTIFDTVLSAEFENLVLLGISNIAATGNAANNALYGNAGQNVLIGHAGNDVIAGGGGNDKLYGGSGRDTLQGGEGSDQFFFTTKGTSSVDRITDFSTVFDVIVLDDAAFSKLKGMGTLSSAQFHRGAAAHDPSDRIIYNSKTGVLTYDANGNAAGGVSLVAYLDKGLAVTHNDFFVI